MDKPGIIKLRMPFKYGPFLREKEVPFLFKIMTLEMICEQLGVEFGEMFDTKKIQMNDLMISIIWNGYLSACKELYKKPKYNYQHVIIWHENMNQKIRDQYMAQVIELFGSLKGTKTSKTKMTQAEKKK